MPARNAEICIGLAFSFSAEASEAKRLSCILCSIAMAPAAPGPAASPVLRS